MLRLSPSSKQHPAGANGFTLVEAMVATVVFSMVILGVYGCMVKAYQLSQLTRYNDQARSILLSYVDQFERLDTVGSGQTSVRPFFTPALTTGVGVNWPALSNDDVGNGSTANYEPITLGDGTSTSTVTAKITRAVYPLSVPHPPTQPEDGTYGNLLAYNTATSTYRQAPGYLVMGIFTITYTIQSSGKQYSQRLAAVRAVP